jgi:DNA uptake protein ComE-like DNA-binding protein
MKRSTNSLTVLCAASIVALVAACAGADEATTDSAAGEVADSTPSVTAPATDSADSQGALVDPSTATRDQLMTVPGLDATTADAIIAGRPYQDMRAVDAVLVNAKFSEAKRDSIYERMFKPLDLNTATKEEIMLIPGVGERMHHEFEEYRPYTDIARFRREIAKYVADSTVRRYEKYVTIK